MTAYEKMTTEERRTEREALTRRYEAVRAQKRSLNMARGKPGREQLELVSGLLGVLTDPEDCVCEGLDVRNYGELAGLPAARRLFAELLDCRPEQCFMGGNSSLQLMYDVVAKAFLHGLPRSPRPWSQEPRVRWLCPCPGYDRHFSISRCFGMEMIPIPMGPEGPDMDRVEAEIRDPAVKGIWCVPKFSNPDGIIYSDETVRRFAALRPAAPDFLILWDNAYCVHEFEGPYRPFPDLLGLCAAAGRPELVFEFASTSKITMPGAGISCLAANEENLAWYVGLAKFQIISYDKVNQLRHVRFLRDKAGVLALMRRHAELLRPKFRCVLDTLEREIAPLGLAEWQKPAGGYFVSVNTLPGLAGRTWELCREAGLTLTAAGATWPEGRDPEDRNLRIAPTYPSLEELRQAMELFCLCLRLAALERFDPQPQSAS